MNVEISIDEQELVQLLRALAPLRIHMTPSDEDRRWVQLEAPTSVRIEPDVGVHFDTHGRLRYRVSGYNVEATIHKVSVCLVPQVVQNDGSQPRLAFKVNLTDGDLEHVPGLVDDFLVSVVNRALTPQDTGMVWDFGKALSKSFSLPDRLEPLRSIDLSATQGELVVASDCLRLRVGIDVAVKRTQISPSEEVLA